MKKKEGLVLYLVQDFVLGTSICSISGSLGWCPEGASIVAKGVLDALIFLHNNGVSHRNLYDCTVFMDNGGTIRVTDFAIVPDLLELIGGQRTNQGDLPALGSLIESLSPTPHFEMRDFIEKCKSERTLSASVLIDHPFLRPTQPGEPIRHVTSATAIVPDRVINQSLNIHHPALISNTGQSRLHTEFKELEFLGQGAYGDVMKVRNVLDNREYAIKRIPLSARNKQLYKKMTREVELLSRLNHENVVRYYNSWIESDTSDNKVNLGSGGDYSDSCESVKQLSKVLRSEESFSSHWDVEDDSSSDGIEFVNSDGDIVESDDDGDKFRDESSAKGELLGMTRSPKPENQIMYIQMEFCEKSTLRL